MLIPRRSVRSSCSFVLRHWIIDLPTIVLMVPTLRLLPSDLRSGIPFIDTTMSQTRAQYSVMVGESLDLLASCNPTRFRRIKAQIRTIANVPAALVSIYVPAIKLCGINFRLIAAGKNTASAVNLLSSVLVYEATYGCLLDKGIVRTGHNGRQFDRCRIAEARRSMLRLGMTTTPWDPGGLIEISQGQKLALAVKDVIASELDQRKD